MESPWRRTLASVFLLLSPHSFLCQNAVPTGPLQLLPFSKESLGENVGIKLGPIRQQIHLIPPPNSVLPKSVAGSQYLAENQRIPEFIDPAYQQPAISQNIGPFPQCAAFGIPNINSLPQIQSPVCNTLLNTNNTPQAPLFNIISAPFVSNKQFNASPITVCNTLPNTNTIPQAPSLNIKLASLVFNKPFNALPITSLSPAKEVSRMSPLSSGLTAQFSNSYIRPVTNLYISQGLQPEVSPVALVPNSQNQIPSLQRPLVPAESALNVPSASNQNTITSFLGSNASQPYVSSSCIPQGAAFGIPNINNLPLIENLVCKTLPNTNTNPQTPPLNIISALSVSHKPFNASPITNLSPAKEVSRNSPLSSRSSAQFPNSNIRPVTNLYVSQGLQPEVLPGPIVPNIQNQIPSLQRLLLPTESALNVPSAMNQNTITSLLVSNPSQPFVNSSSIPQGAAFGILNINNFPQIQNLVCNTLPNTNTTPQAPPLNNISALSVSNKPFNASPITSMSPDKEVSRISSLFSGSSAPFSNSYIRPVSNLYVSQGLQPKVSPVPIVTNLQNQIPSLQRPIFIVPTGSGLNVPSPLNENTIPSLLVSNPYSQPFVAAPCMLATDLKALNFLPSPNLPISEPIQNCPPISQVPMQSVSITPVDYMFNVISPNSQISALPPVSPTIPLNNNFRRNPVPITEEYTPVPINLQIKLPSPTIPEPQITIITAHPPAPPVPVSDGSSDVSLGLYPPYHPPPIIIEGRKSRSKSLLPLILMALIANNRCCGGGGCCCCPSSFGSSDIPIPCQIPIPTNNRIIIESASKSRKKGSKGNVSVKIND